MSFEQTIAAAPIGRDSSAPRYITRYYPLFYCFSEEFCWFCPASVHPFHLPVLALGTGGIERSTTKADFE